MGTRRAILLSTLGAMLWAGPVLGCADDGPVDQVEARARPDADFGAYQTYAIVTPDDVDMLPEPPDDIELPDDLPDDVEASLEVTEDAVRDEMDARGLMEVGVDESPDLYVVDFAATNDEDAIYWECVPGWYWWGWYSYWDSCAWLEPVPVSYTVGSVLVLVVDEDIDSIEDYGRVVFGGLLQGVADGSGNAEQRIQDGVSVMFEQWPE